MKLAIPWYSEIRNHENALMIFPSMSGLIKWEVKIGQDKDSKIPLCFDDPPPEKKILKFKKRLERLFDKVKLPLHIEIPTDEELEEPTEKFLYSEGRILRDKDNPLERHGRFLYQAFMTGFDTPRESWLPSREYKSISKF
jgi:hypothetical protein